MIVVLRKDATEEQIGHLVEKIQKLGLTPHISKGTERTIIGVIGPEDIL
ncbi:MAG: 3-deoxy-7-phosphoheptulonate synthase, partial [Candidatus Omnitrophica bacterium]|nr:3-deoxy-7-phosphoheptulonate synthase [Candidatus Omnitrophota bacterium]